MLTFDVVTRAALKAATTKSEWVQILNEALGNNRRIRAFHDGVEFRNVASVGPFTSVAGTITKLGRINDTTISLAADISSGVSTLRIEGNGRFMQGTLGLSKTAQLALGVSESNVVQYDFVVNKNFTDNNGFAVEPNFVMGAYRFLSSGVGPAAPAITKDAPASFEVWDWTSTTVPVLVGTISLNQRLDNFVYEDDAMARAIGDVTVVGSTQTVTYDVHQFAAILTISDPSNTEVGNVPLYNVIVSCSQNDPTWASYPSRADYDYTKHVVNPKPFKIVMKSGKGDIMHVFEMSDGLAINDLSIPNGRGAVTWEQHYDQHPLRPSFNTAMTLLWQNTQPKINPIAKKIYPGIRKDKFRHSMAKGHFSVLSCEPLITTGYNGFSKNGLANVWGAPQWPKAQAIYNAPNPDPYLNNHEFNYGWSAFAGPWIEGWDYEPGSFSTHNWYTAPGGPRFDRSAIPSTFTMFLTFPDENRLQESVPWKKMATSFSLAYGNHSNHFYKDPRRLYMTSNESILNDEWAYEGVYYGSHTAKNMVRIMGDQRDGEMPWHRDKNGDMFYNGWGRDPLHGYCHSGWGSIVFTSPMFAILGKSDTITSIMLCGPVTNSKMDAYYLVRTMAWEMLAMVMGWITASRHEFGFTKAQMENRMAGLFESLYRDMYVPAYVENSQHIIHAGLRNLGTPIQESSNGTWQTPGGGLGFYLAHILQMMKQTGMWSVMYAKGGHTKIVMDMMIQNMDTYCFGLLCDTPMVIDTYQGWDGHDAYMPTSWADYAARYQPKDGSTLVTNADGSICGDRGVGNHPFLQYPYIRRDYFPEFPNPRIDQAIAKVEEYEAKLVGALNQLSTTAYAERMNLDWFFKYPSLVQIAPPAPGDLGPA